MSLPPNAFDSEQDLLADVLLREGAIDDTAGLSPDDFFSGNHKRIYAAALWLRDANRSIDIVSVGERLRDLRILDGIGGMPFLTELIMRLVKPGLASDRAKLIREKALLRRFISACQHAAAEGYGDLGGDDVQTWVQARIETFSSLVGYGLDDPSEPVGSVAGTALARVERAMAEGRRNGIPTGFDRYDSWTGGLHETELTVLAARPGAGKSSFAGQLALNIAQGGRSVVVFSLEMAKEEWVTRLMASCAEVDATKYRSAALNPDEVRRSKAAAKHLGLMPIVIDDRVGLTFRAMRPKIRSMQAEGEVGLVVVDYLQLMRSPDSSKESREREVASIAQGLKEMAKELRVPVLALSQLNRAVEQRSGGTPMLSDLRESGVIEQAADNVVFIVQGDNDGDVSLTIAKQRSGPTGSCEFRFDKRYLRFSEV